MFSTLMVRVQTIAQPARVWGGPVGTGRALRLRDTTESYRSGYAEG